MIVDKRKLKKIILEEISQVLKEKKPPQVVLRQIPSDPESPPQKPGRSVVGSSTIAKAKQWAANPKARDFVDFMGQKYGQALRDQARSALMVFRPEAQNPSTGLVNRAALFLESIISGRIIADNVSKEDMPVIQKALFDSGWPQQ